MAPTSEVATIKLLEPRTQARGGDCTNRNHQRQALRTTDDTPDCSLKTQD